MPGGQIRFSGTSLPAEYPHSTRCLDANTVCTYVGGSAQLQNVDVAVDGHYSAAYGVSAQLTRDRVLCPALWKDRDPNTPLPPQCGSAELNLDNGGTAIRITRIDFAFQNGHIDISGDFRAINSSDGWATRGGRFSQTLFLSITNGFIVPRLQPEEVQLTFSVHLEWWTWLTVIGIKAVVGGVLAFLPFVPFAWGRSFFPPSIPTGAQRDARADRVTLTRIDISPEGLLSRGFCEGIWEWNPRQSGIRITSLNDPQHRHQTGSGPTTAQVGKCAPQEFEYIQSLQNDHYALTVETDLLVAPLESTWTVNGQTLTTAEHAASITTLPAARPVLKYQDTVHTAVPPPDGLAIPGHDIELTYWVPKAVAGLHRTLFLTARAADLNYSVQVNVQVTDAAGRVFAAAEHLKIVGDIAEFDGDYYTYVYQCAVQSLDVPEHRTKKTWPGGKEELPALLTTVAQLVQDGDPRAAATVPQLVRAVGREKVNAAFTASARRFEVS